jgi:hypothetical protein
MFRGTQLGFGPKSFQSCLRIFQKCWEKLVSACDLPSDSPTDGCCAVVQCEWCVYINAEDEPESAGVAEWYDSDAPEYAGTWAGQIDNYFFQAYWERDADGICWLVIVVNDDVVGRLEKCYLVDCRDPEGTVTGTINPGTPEAKVVTVEWLIRKPVELPLIEEDGCIENFCGHCDCACRTLCATLTYPNGDICRGELVTTGVANGQLVWTGTLDCIDNSTVEASVYMERDMYTGDCVLYAVADGDITDEVVLDDCIAINEILYISQNHSLQVVCSECPCDLSCDGGCTWAANSSMEWELVARPGCVSPCACCSPSIPPECAEQAAACGCWNPLEEGDPCGETGLCQITICPEA